MRIKETEASHVSQLSDLAIKSIIMYRRVRNKVLFSKRMHIEAQSVTDKVVVHPKQED
jgi:hypothetical protein